MICPPELLCRNVVVKGINLFALKNKQFQIDSSTLEYTGLCHPCFRMQEILEMMSYNAVRGHGGITTRITQAGIISIENKVKVF